MRRAIRLLVSSILLLAVAAGAFVVVARQGWLNPEEADLRARYALPNSRFLRIGGQDVHLVDEGQGAPVLLVHGSYGSRRMWDEWARILRAGHRVVRFDRPAMGLSGAAPDGRYGREPEIALIDRLSRQLRLPPFIMVATSSGGDAAAAFAARHPDRVRGIILANIAAGPIAFRPMHQPLSLRIALAVDPYLGGWHSPPFWGGILRMNFADPARVSSELVREWTDLNNRAQFFPRRPPSEGYVPFAQTPADLAAIRAPALLLWSDRDPEVPVGIDGRNALARLGSTSKRLESVADCGHMMPIECGARSARAALAFVDALK